MGDNYRGALAVREEHPEYTVDDAANRYSSNVRWNWELKNNLRRAKGAVYSRNYFWATHYRPFVKQHYYVDYILVNNKYQQDSSLLSPDTKNHAICVPGVGSTNLFSALVVDTMPDLELISKGQCFPSYRYERRNGQRSLHSMGPPPERVDNITDSALRAFRMCYGDNAITKDAIFDYVYDVLHAPENLDC